MEDLEESIRERKLVLDKLVKESVKNAEKLEGLKNNSRNLEVENIELDYQKKRMNRDVDQLNEQVDILKRETFRMAEEITIGQQQSKTLESKKHHYLLEVDKTRDLQTEVVDYFLR